MAGSFSDVLLDLLWLRFPEVGMWKSLLALRGRADIRRDRKIGDCEYTNNQKRIIQAESVIYRFTSL